MDLNAFFHAHPKAALAFSGGVDSAYLLYAAIQCGAAVRAYFVKSAFQPLFELEDARRLAESLHADWKVLEADVLAIPQVTQNPPDRCYFCKKALFSAIRHAALEDGYSLLLDGTNASDDVKDRPGMRAMEELSVLSPLRMCGLTKAEIRRRSREAGLFTWDKPAYACLATRIPTGTEITADKLARTEAAEQALFSLGFRDFRIRMLGDAAKLQVPEAQLPKVLENRSRILEELRHYYHSVLLDLEVRDA
ncbi:ATP-dependent sacrificial sulfur transferase LarE [Dysosmobacter sp.]|uniref:ATP-dependent sacrificial sulfur transferase LarE n=1 Tax=Dysosmobacter sp. TaxID=2591382 RepID=UPI00260E2054|nr:ATP-dependent sacrificial sulfur transferase LarE [Dysosmobacter sp.]